MSIDRRTLLGSIAASSLVSACGRGTSQGDGSYPAKDITFIIPVAPGGGADIYARLIGAAMERHLPNRVNIVPFNVPSGGGGKGVTQLFRAAPDGYTIGILNIPGIFVLQRMRQMPYDLSRFTWLGAVTEGEHYGLAVRWDSPFRSVQDLQRESQRRELTFTATGPEGTAYTATQISTRMLGLRHRMVTGYRGSNDYVVGAMRGDGDAVVAALSVIQRLQEGQSIRLLATFDDEPVTTAIPNARAIGHPDLAQITAERVIAAPPGTPENVRNILAAALAKASREPDVVSFAQRIGETLSPKTPDQIAAMIAERRAFLDRWLTTDAGAPTSNLA